MVCHSAHHTDWLWGLYGGLKWVRIVLNQWCSKQMAAMPSNSKWQAADRKNRLSIFVHQNLTQFSTFNTLLLVLVVRSSANDDVQENWGLGSEGNNLQGGHRLATTRQGANWPRFHVTLQSTRQQWLGKQQSCSSNDSCSNARVANCDF